MVLLMMMSSMSAFAGVCASGANDYRHIKNSGTWPSPSDANPPYAASDYISTPSTGQPAKAGPFGVNVIYDTMDDAHFSTGGWDVKMDQTGARVKALRFPGGTVGERYLVTQQDGRALSNTASYGQPTITNFILGTTLIDELASNGKTNFNEFIDHAYTISNSTGGVDGEMMSLYFVVNVQEAFGRCNPVNATSATAACVLHGAGNLDNVDPMNSATHWTSIDAAVDNYATKAANWAGWINAKVNAKWTDPAHRPTVYFELGNEVNLGGSPYPLSDVQYKDVLDSYIPLIKTVNSNFKVGVVGPTGVTTATPGANGSTNVTDAVWWTTAMSSYSWDFGIIHGSYRESAFKNPTLSTPTDSCAGGAAGKRGPPPSYPCRPTDWPPQTTAVNINNIKTYTGKPVSITEWGASDTGSTWWLDGLLGRYPTPALNSYQGMVSMIGTIGIWLSSADLGYLNHAIMWPGMYSSDNNYRQMFSFTSPYGGTAVKNGFDLVSGALSGKYQTHDVTMGKQVAVWQTQTVHTRNIVIANAELTAIRVPITFTTSAPTIYANAKGSSESGTVCNYPTTGPVPAGIVVGPESVTVLTMYK